MWQAYVRAEKISLINARLDIFSEEIVAEDDRLFVRSRPLLKTDRHLTILSSTRQLCLRSARQAAGDQGHFRRSSCCAIIGKIVPVLAGGRRVLAHGGRSPPTAPRQCGHKANCIDGPPA